MEASMPLNIRSDEVNRLAEKLAARRRVTKTEAVKQALRNELRRIDGAVPLWERLAPLRRKIAALPDTGL
jgi:antitoxin VapB